MFKKYLGEDAVDYSVELVRLEVILLLVYGIFEALFAHLQRQLERQAATQINSYSYWVILENTILKIWKTWLGEPTSRPQN